MLIKEKVSGFTLIELMIVVAIIAVIAGIAYPSYMEYVRKSNRADAKAELNNIAQRLQRCFTTYSAYNHDNCSVAASLKGGGKINSGEDMYEVTATILTATAYAIEATPIAGKIQAGDEKCTKFTLTNAGARGAEGSAINECW